MKLFFEYARRVGPHGAVVFQANPLVVSGVYDAPCHNRITPCAGGFSGNGYSFDLLFGGKWRWHARHAPLLGTFDLTFGAVPLFERDFDDNGVAVVGRAGGGLVVLLARHVGLRFDAHMLAGPGVLGLLALRQLRRRSIRTSPSTPASPPSLFSSAAPTSSRRCVRSR